MKFLLLTVLLMGSAMRLRAQDSLVQRVGLQLIYHPSDLFAGVHYERERGHFQHQFLLSTGVKRTFFQQRFYPQAGYQLGFHVVHYRWLQAGPFVRATVAMSNANRQAKHGYTYNENLFVGAYVGTGNRNRFRLSAGIGPSWEQSWSPLKSGFRSYTAWQYFGEISWSHAL